MEREIPEIMRLVDFICSPIAIRNSNKKKTKCEFSKVSKPTIII